MSLTGAFDLPQKRFSHNGCCSFDTGFYVLKLSRQSNLRGDRRHYAGTHTEIIKVQSTLDISKSKFIPNC